VSRTEGSEERSEHPLGLVAMRQGGTLEEGDLPMKKAYVRVAVLATSAAALLLAGGAQIRFR